MPTASAGTSGSYTFAANEQALISPTQGEACDIEVRRAGVIISSQLITTERTIGPFRAGDVMTLTAQRGAIDFTISAYTGSHTDTLDSSELTAIQALVSVVGISGATFPALESDLVLPFAKSGGLVSQADDTALTLVRGAISLAELTCKQSTLPVRTVMVGASGTIAVGACAVVGIQAITLGTGSITIHDDLNAAADAARLRFERAVSAMVAGSYYPMVADDPTAMLFDKGAFVTLPTGGLYAVDLVDTRNLPGVEAAGLLCVPQRVAATGVAFYGRNNVVSVKVVAPGSAGSLSIYSNVNAADPLRLRFPVTAFGSLAADQIIRFGSRGCGASFMAMHVTVPTGGIVLVNALPR